KLPTSKQQTMTQCREINIRAQLSAHLTDIGRSGLEKLCIALNIRAPIDEDHYTATDAYLLDIIQIHQQNSVDLSVKEAVQEASSINLKVSGDGSWITRGHSSAHRNADICSTTKRPKVIGVERSSKECSQCIAAQSIRKSNSEKYEIFVRIHPCEINYAVPKHRYASGLMIDIGVGLAVTLYNDGYKKLHDLFERLFNSCGYWTNHGIIALDTSKEHDRQMFFSCKRTRKVNEQQRHKIVRNNDDNSSDDEHDESDGYLYSIMSSDEDGYEPGGLD
ncbi:unnamed protein product, partial [Didymodactylos carnosus]